MQHGSGSRKAAVGAVLGGILLAGCAGGESDTVGAINLTNGPPGAETSADGTGGPSEDGSGTTPTSGSGTSGLPTTDPTAPTDTDDPSAPTSAETTGPPASCVLSDDCDDADLCTEDNCINSECSNAPLACDDGVGCTVDACDPATGACTNMPDDTACADADLCNGDELCDPLLDCFDGTPVLCSDGQACTLDSCDPSTGVCSAEAIDACTSGDGCCPVGCSVADSDCTCTNLAMSATASSSGGGVGDYGPEAWINGVGEDSCAAGCLQCFGWIDNSSTPSGAFLQLDWGSPQLIGSMFIDSADPGTCSVASRPLAGGNVQYWSAGSWVTASTFAGETGDLEFSFSPPITTTRIRIYDAVAPPGVINSVAFEWYVYEPLGCTP